MIAGQVPCPDTAGRAARGRIGRAGALWADLHPFRSPGMTHVTIPVRLRVFALVLMLLAPFAAHAAPTGYTGEAPVASQSDEDRTEALKVALANVVVERSGDAALPSRPDVAKALAQAERYVLQYQYKRGGAEDGSSRLILVAQFDSVAVDRLLQRSGAAGEAEKATAPETPTEATVWIGGIRNADDYARAIAYLGRSNFVRNAQPVRARGDGMLMRLSLSTDLAHFLDVVGMERTLGVDATAKTDGADAVLALQP